MVLTQYQREALGFGSKAMWPATEAFNRSDIAADWPTAALVPVVGRHEDRLEATQADADAASKRFWQRSSWYRRASIRNESLADQIVIDDVSTQGALYTDDVMEAAAAGELMARRRIEDERYAYFAEASIVFLDLPGRGVPRLRGRRAVARHAARGRRHPRSSCCARRSHGSSRSGSTCRSESAVTWTTSSVVTSGIRLLQDGRRWVMPGPDYAGIVAFYEDFPYAWWTDFRGVRDLPGDPLAALPPDVGVIPEFADVTDQLERKIMGVSLYESQLDRLFDGTRQMADAVRAYGRAMAEVGGVDGSAERYWVSGRV